MLVDYLLKTKKEFRNLKKQEEIQYIYIYIYIYIYTERDKNELDTACFQHNMVYGDFKDLARGKASHKALHDRACNIAKNPK